MAGKPEQNTEATATATFESGALFGAVAGIALHIAPDLELAPAKGEDEVDLAIRLLGEIKVRAENVVAELGDKADEIERLNRSIAGHKGLTTRERKKAEALEAQLPPKPRKFAVIYNPLTSAELLELIDGGGEVVLAFVGAGGSELKDVPPRTIDGDAWQEFNGQLRLRVPSLLVHGPVPGGKPHVLAGYALLIDGEHVATAERVEPLTIGASTKFELAGDVIFN